MEHDDSNRLDALILRLSELEGRQARMDKAMARQRRVNEVLFSILESVDWEEIRRATNGALDIE